MQQHWTIEEIQKGYSAWASQYDQMLLTGWSYRAPQEMGLHLRPYLRSGEKLLDVACGTGLNSAEFPEQNVYGVDFASGMLMEYRNKGFTGRFADIRELPFENNFFDSALCTAALENYQDPSPIVAEMSRVVRPGGIVAFTVCVSPMDGCHTTNKEAVESFLLPLGLRTLKSFEFTSHFEYGKAERPINYLGTICLNSKL
jgi:ubiquinone/menaquinone biosynthesis C-methylase UbiE